MQTVESFDQAPCAQPDLLGEGVALEKFLIGDQRPVPVFGKESRGGQVALVGIEPVLVTFLLDALKGVPGFSEPTREIQGGTQIISGLFVSGKELGQLVPVVERCIDVLVINVHRSQGQKSLLVAGQLGQDAVGQNGRDPRFVQPGIQVDEVTAVFDAQLTEEFQSPCVGDIFPSFGGVWLWSVGLLSGTPEGQQEGAPQQKPSRVAGKFPDG